MNKLGNLISTFNQVVRRGGLSAGINAFVNWIVGFFGMRYKDVAQKRRGQLSKILDHKYKSIIQHGPFKGMRLAQNNWWGKLDRAAILLGLYEREVVQSIIHTPTKYKYFIDVGAADGLYAVGMLFAGRFEKSYCFEISEKGRQIIFENAKLNNQIDRMEIMDKAGHNFYENIPEEVRSQSVLLMDIEGGEFELACNSFFNGFKKSIIYIEIHDWFYKDGKQMTERLLDSAKFTHSVTELTTTSRDLSKFPDLNSFSDNDRWLLCSEGRGCLMKWLRFEPIE